VRPLVKSCNALFLAFTLERAQASSTNCWVRTLHWECKLLVFCDGQSYVREVKAHFEVKVPYLPASMLLPLQSRMVNPCEKKMVYGRGGSCSRSLSMRGRPSFCMATTSSSILSRQM
jgi:hypothetical protein